LAYASYYVCINYVVGAYLMFVMKMKAVDKKEEITFAPIYPEDFEYMREEYKKFTQRQRKVYRDYRTRGVPKIQAFQAAEGVGKEYVILK
jgi:hypothetical protein